MERVVAKALEEGIEVPYAQDPRPRNALLPEGASELENWPWPLKVFTLGRFDLIREDRQVPFSRKVQQKPLSLLKALIALGGKEVPEEQLTDALWPEATATCAPVLRHDAPPVAPALRKRESPPAAGGPPDAGWTPRMGGRVGFEGLLRRAEPHEGRGWTGLRTRRLSAWRSRPSPCTKGPSWREMPPSPGSYRQGTASGQVPESRRGGGASVEIAGEWEKAAACYHGGLDVDDLAEIFYRRLMVCLKRMGRDSEAHAAYHRCRKTFAARLGRNPSPETKPSSARRTLVDIPRHPAGYFSSVCNPSPPACQGARQGEMPAPFSFRATGGGGEP